MRHIIFEEATTYPVALLIKASAFNQREIEKAYAEPLTERGLAADQMIAFTLAYNEHGKAPVSFIKSYLTDNLLPALDRLGTKTLYVADTHYFKVLAKVSKADPHQGYALPCSIPGYEHMEVILGLNHKALMYNPANQPKLDLSLNTLVSVVNQTYQELGQGIIHHGEYPEYYGDIAAALEKLHAYPELSADIETASLRFNEAGIATIGFAWSQHEGIAFACDYSPLSGCEDGVYGEFQINGPVRHLLRQFFERYQGTLRWHGSTFDLKVLIYTLWMKDPLDTRGLLEGLEVMTARFHDTKIIAYLATNSTAGNSLGLKDLAHEFAGNYAQDVTNVFRVPLPELLEYNLVDCLCTNYVFDQYHPRMVRDQQEDLYHNLMLPSIKTILQMELTGMPLSETKVQEAKAELEAKRNEAANVFFSSPVIQKVNRVIQEDAQKAANAKLKVKQHPLEHFSNVTFNPNSGPQLQKLLHDVMDLPIIDLTKTKQPATGADTLEKLINHTSDPEYQGILQALIDFTKVEKILSTFIPAFERALHKKDGMMYLHGSLILGGTVSGRLSSKEPNMQNLPSGSEYGKLIKKCFVAPSGWLFCGADFTSLEDYISALTTKDPAKLDVYLKGYDGHCLRAFSYFPERLPGITNTVESINSIKDDFPDVRQDSKSPTFALTYRGTWRTLVNNLGFDPQKAKEIEDSYHVLYKVSDDWVQAKLDQAAIDGYVEVAFGLRIRTPLLAQTVLGHRTTPYEAEAEGRTAGNALGQSYGLLTNRAANAFMERVWNSPYRHRVKPVTMIHDAIYLLIADDVKVVRWVNQELIKAMQWQELPEIQHDEVKLGAGLEIYYPSWADPIDIPNEATIPQIHAICDPYNASNVA